MKQCFNVWFVVLLFVLSFSTISAQKANPESDFNCHLNKEGTGVVIQRYKGKATNVVIPSVIEDFPVVKLDEYAFSKTTVESVVIPDSITNLGSGVFRGCEYLKKVTLPKGLNSIPESFFSGCSALEKITLPKDLKTIGEWSFSGCTALKEITLPEGLKEIERGAFSSSCLESVTVPDSVVYISYGAFDGCINLKTVTIGSGIKGIGVGAFNDCSSLTTFNIGVEKLEKREGDWNSTHGYGESVFEGCSSLSLKEKAKIRKSGYEDNF